MISHESRCIYRNNQLAEVACQLRFPQILTIQTDLPAAFQEAIRDLFPIYTLRKEGLPGSQINNYQFSTPDGRCRVNLSSRNITLTVSRYTCWEDFAAMLDKPLAAFIQLYKPAFFDRIGLRYVNFISRKALQLQEVPFRELISPCYLGILNEDDVLEKATVRSTVDADTALRGGCRCKIHAGPGNVKVSGVPDPEVKFILDMDLYMPGNVDIKLSAGALQTLHAQSYGLFRGAITDTLHDALNPR